MGELEPLLSTACHSSSERWSGYVMFADEEDELKRDPKKGIVGIDLMTVPRMKGESAR